MSIRVPTGSGGGKGSRKDASDHKVRPDGRRVGESQKDFRVRIRNEIRGFKATMS